MRIAIVLLIILNFIWLETYLNIYSKYKSKCTECDELAKFSSKLRTVGRLDQTLFDSQSKELSTLRSESRKQRSKIYRLRNDIKRKDRAIVRYKAQNEVYKHGYHESEKRNKKLRRMYTTEIQTEQWLREMWYMMIDERDAYLYCLRQIQEEVTNAKEE